MKLEPKILFEDPHLWVIDKPAGLLTQGEHTGADNLVDWLRARAGRPYIGLVHRLDRNTSGLLVVAKRSKAAGRLTTALQSGALQRTYLAWVMGKPPAQFEWTHHLLKNEATNQSRVVPPQTPGAKEARLKGNRLHTGTHLGYEASLVEFVLDTGRSHQIRVQSAASGHALIGDSKYGSKEFGGGGSFERLALHSWKMSFPHPVGGALLSFESPPPF